ncbi:hypothetical protein AK812_SmicGene3385 [Symbiodinium microadriaticum]|uniref:Uncharacterized protein n=1 Tax=Symbiodinium microadriaticum TaxID=2951 RepID=A0A1Q9EZ09_SYMMI|nr:hypothetical protein AK812_SmicGene3385 [Symbiodinium microadriaticum]
MSSCSASSCSAGSRAQQRKQVEPTFGYEDRAELLDDLLEDDTTTAYQDSLRSSFPLLEAPREVLAAIGTSF